MSEKTEDQQIFEDRDKYTLLESEQNTAFILLSDKSLVWIIKYCFKPIKFRILDNSKQLYLLCYFMF